MITETLDLYIRNYSELGMGAVKSFSIQVCHPNWLGPIGYELKNRRDVDSQSSQDTVTLYKMSSVENLQLITELIGSKKLILSKQ